MEKFHDLVLEGVGVNPVEVYDPDVDQEEYQLDPNHGAVLCHEIIPLERKKVIVNFWRGKKNGKKRKFSQVQNKHPEVGDYVSILIYVFFFLVQSPPSFRSTMI